MKNIRPGSLEMAVLSVVRSLNGIGYGVNIQEQVSEILERDVSFGSMYTTLGRLEESGMLQSEFGNPTPERGGRAKKFYRITGAGESALRRAESKLRVLLPAATTLAMS